LDLTAVKGQPRWFWRCASGDRLIKMRCADHLIFSNKLKTCTWPPKPINHYAAKASSEERGQNAYRAESGERNGAYGQPKRHPEIKYNARPESRENMRPNKYKAPKYNESNERHRRPIKY
jgi:hypothetical protein